ncbi:HAD family hydrolase [Paenibacillus sp. MBLB4367]|uniref:HAD family hydrolase n=1 Tax=Paenibacillus sp. MBLB4367 TaxID=3384767 RepID=UPI0039084452
MRPQTLLFDLDDTLVHCNKYFDMVIDQCADQLMTWFASDRLTADEVKKKQLEIDTARVAVQGFMPDHFPQSLIDTYHYFSALTGRETSRSEEESLRELGKSVYDQEVEPYPNMVETLDLLKGEGHSLFLYTGGVATVQERKIKALGLETYFGDRVFIRRHKTTDALEDILNKQRFDRDLTWMIGNSIRTDIVPALETGIHAVHVPAILEWQFNIVDIHVRPKGAFLQVPTLREVPTAIAGYGILS